MRSKVHRIIPSFLVLAATAVPFATAADILNRAQVGTNAAAVGATPNPTSSIGSANGSQSTSGTQSAAATTGTQSTTTPAGTAPQTYVGAAEWNRFGSVQATLVVAAGKITGVTISAPGDNQRSAYINGVAVPILQSETLQAQSASVTMVSGATYTSDSYIQSLQDALAQAHL